MNTVQHWIVVVDERSARLLAVRRSAHDRWQAELYDALGSPWECIHEQHRPSALSAHPSPQAHQRFSSGYSEMETQEEQRRFARDVVDWLEQKRSTFGEQPLSVYAAPRFFGLLRAQMTKKRFQADLHEAELTRLLPHELIEHPAVLEALARPLPTGPA